MKRSILLIVLIVVFAAGCDAVTADDLQSVSQSASAGITAAQTQGPTAEPILSPAPTPVPTPEPTPEPPRFTIPRSLGSARTMNAVIDGYWVSAGNGGLYSVPLDAMDAEPLLLEAQGVFALWAWGDTAAVYARPSDEEPYRIILYKPDGSGRTVIPFRQSELINPIWIDGDYCYAHESGMIRRLTLSDMTLENLFSVPFSNVYGVVNRYVVAFDFRANTLYYFPLDGGDVLSLYMMEAGLQMEDILSVTLIDGGVLLTNLQDALFVDEQFVVRRIGGTIRTDELYPLAPQYISASRQSNDALGNEYERFLLGAEGIYPYDNSTAPVPDGLSGDGAAIFSMIDPSGLIPLEDFPVVPIEPTITMIR